MELQILREVGLSDGEIKIYQILIDEGQQTVTHIHEKAGIERRNIYDILNKLIQKGLVSYITENRTRLFKITHPDKIISYLEDQKNTIDRTKEKVQKLDKELLQKFNSTRSRYDAQIFRGNEGMKAVWDDMLKAKNIFWMGSGGYVPRRLPHYHRRWNRLRAEKGIPVRHLYRVEYKVDIDLDQMIGDLGEVKYLPKEFSGNPTVICVWGDKVGNFMMGDLFLVFVIESKELADNYRDYFEYVWDNVAEE